MSQVQEFLNKFGFKQQPGKKGLKTGFSGDEKSPICIDPFDGGKSARQSVTPDEDNSTCIYCDVDPDEFWEFLYSDKWNDNVILRVFPGELYNNLDLKLNEMLKEDSLAKHITCAYLKVESGRNKMGFEMDPETLRIEFTYYGKNLEKPSGRTVKSFKPAEASEDNSLVTNSANVCPGKVLSLTRPMSQRSEELQSRHSKHVSQKIEEYHAPARPKNRPPSPPARKFVNISLGYYYSLNSLDIDDDIESDCGMFDIRRRGKLGLSRDMFGTSQTSMDDAYQRRKKGEPRTKKVPSRRNKLWDDLDQWEPEEEMRPYGLWHRERQFDINEQKMLWAVAARKRQKKGEEEDWDDEEEDDEDDDEEEDEEVEHKVGEEEKGEDSKGVGKLQKQKIGKKKGGKEGTKTTNKASGKKGKSSSFLYPMLSHQLTLRTMGKILEREKHLNFNKMTVQARRKFIITDDRIMRMNRSTKKLKVKKKLKPFENVDFSKLKHHFVFKRVSNLSKNLHEFALLVMGITDSVELYRTIIWMGRDRDYNEGKWKSWYESRLKAKLACQIFNPKENTSSPGSEEKRSLEETLNVGGQVDSMDRKSTDRKDKADKEKASKGKSDKGKIDKGIADKGKIDRSKAKESKIGKGFKKDTSAASKGYKAKKKYKLKPPPKKTWFEKGKAGKKKVGKMGEKGDEAGQAKEGDEEKEEKEDKEDEEEKEKKESVPRRYDWEMSGDAKQNRIKPEIFIPDFTQKEYVVRSTMMLKAMNYFILRKERVTSSKDRCFTSLAFIRPSFAQKLFQSEYPQ